MLECDLAPVVDRGYADNIMGRTKSAGDRRGRTENKGGGLRAGVLAARTYGGSLLVRPPHLC
jgi:hypothetical protein